MVQVIMIKIPKMIIKRKLIIKNNHDKKQIKKDKYSIELEMKIFYSQI